MFSSGLVFSLGIGGGVGFGVVSALRKTQIANGLHSPSPFFSWLYHHPFPSPITAAFNMNRLLFYVFLTPVSSGAGQKTQLRVAFAYFSAITGRDSPPRNASQNRNIHSQGWAVNSLDNKWDYLAHATPPVH